MPTSSPTRFPPRTNAFCARRSFVAPSPRPATIPEALTLGERQRLLVAYGRQLARDPRGVGDELYASLAGEFTPPQIVALTAFGGLMIATNVFNDALRVDLDEGLARYRPAAAAAAEARTRRHVRGGLSIGLTYELRLSGRHFVQAQDRSRRVAERVEADRADPRG